MKLPYPGAIQGNACCKFIDFMGGFAEQFEEWMGVPPSDDAWKAALEDWKAGNTGWEAAHNARRRAREAVEKTLAKPLVWLGGKNYAEQGSALALKYGRPKPWL